MPRVTNMRNKSIPKINLSQKSWIDPLDIIIIKSVACCPSREWAGDSGCHYGTQYNTLPRSLPPSQSYLTLQNCHVKHNGTERRRACNRFPFLNTWIFQFCVLRYLGRASSVKTGSTVRSLICTVLRKKQLSCCDPDCTVSIFLFPALQASTPSFSPQFYFPFPHPYLASYAHTHTHASASGSPYLQHKNVYFHSEELLGARNGYLSRPPWESGKRGDWDQHELQIHVRCIINRFHCRNCRPCMSKGWWQKNKSWVRTLAPCQIEWGILFSFSLEGPPPHFDVRTSLCELRR